MYFITAINGCKNKRCFGYYLKLEDSLLAIKENYGNLHECLYTDLVLEQINSGIHGESKEIKWFSWKNNKWTESKKPKWAEGIVNWAIG